MITDDKAATPEEVGAAMDLSDEILDLLQQHEPSLAITALAGATARALTLLSDDRDHLSAGLRAFTKSAAKLAEAMWPECEEREPREKN